VHPNQCFFFKKKFLIKLGWQASLGNLIYLATLFQKIPKIVTNRHKCNDTLLNFVKNHLVKQFPKKVICNQ